MKLLVMSMINRKLKGMEISKVISEYHEAKLTLSNLNTVTFPISIID